MILYQKSGLRSEILGTISVPDARSCFAQEHEYRLKKAMIPPVPFTLPICNLAVMLPLTAAVRIKSATR